jgi:lipopolysaccharide export LptBFGC system permease protein LptF
MDFKELRKSSIKNSRSIRLFSRHLHQGLPKCGDFMRILDLHIGKQVLLGTLYAVLVLGVVLVLGNLFKQIQPLLVDQKAPVELVLRFVLSVLPLSLMFTIPWGFLSAVLLVFGRLSSDHEVTAMRVAGVGLIRISAPVFVIGALLSLASMWININVVPQSKATSVRLLYEQAKRDPDSLLKPGVAQGNFKADADEILKVLIEGRSGEWVQGFHFYQLPDKGGDRTYVHASKAALSVDEPKSQLRVKLEDAYFETHKENGTIEMAFAGKAEPLLIDLKNPQHRKLRASAMSNSEILHEVATNPDFTPARRVVFRSEITRRYTFSMACFSFAFIAVPLGLTKRRKDTSSGLILSLLIGTGYFLASMLAEQFKSEPATTLMLWAPNIGCVLLGLFLFRRARFK